MIDRIKNTQKASFKIFSNSSTERTTGFPFVDEDSAVDWAIAEISSILISHILDREGIFKSLTRVSIQVIPCQIVAFSNPVMILETSMKRCNLSLAVTSPLLDKISNFSAFLRNT